MEFRQGNLAFRTVFTDNCGNHYEGEVIRGTEIKQGKGILVCPKGTVYEGYFHDNRFHFRGRMIWEHGSSHVGQYKYGDKDGYGV